MRVKTKPSYCWFSHPNAHGSQRQCMSLSLCPQARSARTACSALTSAVARLEVTGQGTTSAAHRKMTSCPIPASRPRAPEMTSSTTSSRYAPGWLRNGMGYSRMLWRGLHAISLVSYLTLSQFANISPPFRFETFTNVESWNVDFFLSVILRFLIRSSFVGVFLVGR